LTQDHLLRQVVAEPFEHPRLPLRPAFATHVCWVPFSYGLWALGFGLLVVADSLVRMVPVFSTVSANMSP
jgi:hypothetical protein